MVESKSAANALASKSSCSALCAGRVRGPNLGKRLRL